MFYGLLNVMFYDLLVFWPDNITIFRKTTFWHISVVREHWNNVLCSMGPLPASFNVHGYIFIFSPPAAIFTKGNNFFWLPVSFPLQRNHSWIGSVHNRKQMGANIYSSFRITSLSCFYPLHVQILRKVLWRARASAWWVGTCRKSFYVWISFPVTRLAHCAICLFFVCVCICILLFDGTEMQQFYVGRIYCL